MRTMVVRNILVSTLLVAGCGTGTSARSSGPPSSRTPGDPLTTAWRWTAPRPSSVGIPGADGSGVAATFGHSHVVLVDGAGRVRWTADHAHLRDVAPRLTADAVLV